MVKITGLLRCVSLALIGLVAVSSLICCTSDKNSIAVPLEKIDPDSVTQLVWEVPDSLTQKGTLLWIAGYVFDFQGKIAAFYSTPWSSNFSRLGPIYLSSQDGLRWDLTGPLPYPITSEDDLRFFMQCNPHGCVSDMYWSTDLLHWEALDTAQFESAERVLATDSLFYRFHRVGPLLEVWTSPEGGQWTKIGNTNYLDLWQKVSMLSTGMVIGNYFSKNGLQWDTIPLWNKEHSEILTWVSEYDGTYIAVYSSSGFFPGQQWCSQNLKSWKQCSHATPWDSELKYRWFKSLGDSLYWVVQADDNVLVDLRSQKIIPVSRTYSSGYQPVRRGDTVWIAGTLGIQRIIRKLN